MFGFFFFRAGADAFGTGAGRPPVAAASPSSFSPCHFRTSRRFGTTTAAGSLLFTTGANTENEEDFDWRVPYVLGNVSRERESNRQCSTPTVPP